MIDLSYFGGMTVTEIAEEHGLSVGTVKRRARRALQRLRHEVIGDRG